MVHGMTAAGRPYDFLGINANRTIKSLKMKRLLSLIMMCTLVHFLHSQTLSPPYLPSSTAVPLDLSTVATIETGFNASRRNEENIYGICPNSISDLDLPASERNNNFFEIERSQNGIDFEVIGKKRGAGTSVHLQRYESLDKHPFRGVNYYRLKQVDFDGRFEYSAIKAVHLKVNEIDITVFPNPVSNHLNFRTTDDLQKQNLRIHLFDSRGKLVLDRNFSDQLDLSFLTEGMYWLRVSNGEGVSFQKKIIKQN